MLEIYEKGEIPDNIIKLTRLCEYYSVPFIDVGFTLFKNFGKSIKEFTSHYFHDNCHPIDIGYAGYADLILEFLEKAEFCEFDGSVFGIFYMLANDNGSIDYCFDGGEWNNLILWNKYAPLGHMAHWMILNDRLNEGHHVIKIRVSETKAESAEGHFVRIGAFLVG